jgi:hypothetical protein
MNAEHTSIGGHFGLLWRCMLFVGAVLSFGVAVIIVMAVIPGIKADTFPGATPDKAARASQVIAIVVMLVGAALLGMAFVTPQGRRAGKVLLLVVLGLMGLVLTLIFLDGADAYAHEGPGMKGVTTALYPCIGAELIVGLTALAAAVLRWRQPMRQTTDTCGKLT